MSGIDEQDRDVVPCDCKEYQYWSMYTSTTPSAGSLLGYLNPNSWLDTGYRKSINRIDGRNKISRDDFINKVKLFYCEWCKQEVVKGHKMFERLCSNVRTRWDV